MSAREKTWDGRGDKLTDARMSWIAGRAADDLRLSEMHLRLLAHLGRQNHRRGWLRLSQQELAEQWQGSRTRLNAVIKDLVEWGYVMKRSQAQTGESFCTYKVRLDDPEDGSGECLAGETPPRQKRARGECLAGETPGVSRPGDTSVSPRDTPVSRPGDTPHYIPARAPTTPTIAELEHPTHTSTRPDRVCESGGSLVDELAAEGRNLHVVEHLIRPLWGVLTFGPGQEPASLLRAIRDDLAEFADAALADGATDLRRARSQWPSIAKAREAVQAAQGRHMVRIEPGTTAWAAWVEHWHRTGASFLARTYAAQGYATVTRQFPPVEPNREGAAA